MWSTTALVALLGAAAADFAAGGASVEPEAQSDERSGQVEEEVLHTLRNGSSEERLDAARHLDRVLGSYRPGQEAPSTSVDSFVDELTLVLRRETDDWIARTALDSLLGGRSPALNRLFREALRSGSGNVQAMGIRRFTNRTDPEAVEVLESLWERDFPAWMRVELIEALAEQGSAAHLDDFMRLTRDDDPETREAAIEALDTLARPEAIPVLVRVSRAGTLEDQAAALRALGAFSDSDEALQELLRASRSGERSLQSASVGALGRLRRPEADERLIALLEAPPDPDLRGEIVEALEDSSDPDTTAALVRLLHQPEVGADSWIGSTAVRVLHNRDDPDAVAGLMDLVRDPGEDARDEMGELIKYLSRDRSDGRKTISFTTHCSFGRLISPDDARAWHVAPLPPLETIRCWDEPERVGDPESQPRIPAGMLVRITDHFERPDHLWVEIEGMGAEDCWVMQDDLVKGPAPPEPLSSPRRFIRHEFDIGSEELEEARAARLSEAGLLDTFEPGDTISGVALEIDASDSDQAALLRAQLSKGRSALDAALRFVLMQADPEVVASQPDDRDDDDWEDDGAPDDQGEDWEDEPLDQEGP